MDTSDKRDSERWSEYWGRKHDERHGPACDCLWNRATGRGARMLPVELDTTPAGKRIAVRPPAGE